MTVLREQQQRAAASEDLFPRISRAQRDCASAGVGPLGFGVREPSFVYVLFGFVWVCLVLFAERREASHRERERDTHSQAVVNSPRSTECVLKGKKGWSRVEAAREAAGCDQKTQGPGDRSGWGLWGW